MVDVESETPAPGRGIGLAAATLCIAWVGATGFAAYRYIGPEQLAALDPIALAMIGAAAVLPALMVWLAAVAMIEGARARHEAKRLADAAAGLLNPAAHSESAARRLAVAVRGEITALDRALEQTVSKLKEVEASVSRQTHAVSSVAAQAKAGADNMISGLEHERAELLRIAEDLNGQAHLIGQSISRHTQQIAQAAQLAEQEVRAADELIEGRLSSFGAAAALITDRTQALTGAAAESADSALRLETALSSALETLAKATHLTEAARQSAEAATLAANSTAGAIRDTTARAIEDAKRAADIIRGEAQSVERDADAAMGRLRDAADKARGAARQARHAVEPEPPPERKMTSFNRGPADIAPRPPAPEPAPAPKPARAKRDDMDFSDAPASPLHPSAPASNGGAWTWRELLSSIDDDRSAQTPAAAPRERAAKRPAPQTADDPIARLTQAVTEQRGPHPIAAAAVIERAGVNLGEVFTASSLDRIAHRARNGTQARRKAVKDAVGNAIDRLRRHLQSSEAARHEAAGFLRTDGARIAELLSRGRASMSADATRAFLLLDAAEG